MGTRFQAPDACRASCRMSLANCLSMTVMPLPWMVLTWYLACNGCTHWAIYSGTLSTQSCHSERKITRSFGTTPTCPEGHCRSMHVSSMTTWPYFWKGSRHYLISRVAYHRCACATTAFGSCLETSPIAVRPYRDPQLQKDEIERQCEDMLQQRFHTGK